MEVIAMKCSDCFYCESRSEFFFCGYHSLEVYNPSNAGCNMGSGRNVKFFKKLFKASDTSPLPGWFEQSHVSGITCIIS